MKLNFNYKLMLLLAGATLGLSVADASSRKYPVNMDSSWAQACERDIKDRVYRHNDNVERVRWKTSTVQEWDESRWETVVAGKGEYRDDRNRWTDFSFHCVYDKDNREVKHASWDPDERRDDREDYSRRDNGEVIAGIRIYRNIKRSGADYKNFNSGSVNACAQACAKDRQCKAFNYGKEHHDCHLKNNVPQGVQNNTVISGVKD